MVVNMQVPGPVPAPRLELQTAEKLVPARAVRACEHEI